MADSLHISKEPLKENKITKSRPAQLSNKELLREEAEEMLEKKIPAPIPLKSTYTPLTNKSENPDIQKLVYELEVHQIELEMQNKELNEAKEQLQRSVEKYTELYDFSPSGYFTLSREGNIIDLNLFGSQLLGKDRMNLRNTRFGFFVADDSRPEFNRFIETVFTTKCKTSCEITLCTRNTDLPINLYRSD